MSWDGHFNEETEGEVFASVIDLVLNCTWASNIFAIHVERRPLSFRCLFHLYRYAWCLAQVGFQISRLTIE